MRRIRRDRFDIKTYQLNFKQEVPASVLTSFLQESAENHAVELGFDVESLIKQKLTWVLLRLQLKLFTRLSGRQTIEIETWPSGLDKRYAYRDFMLFQEGAKEPFAVASTAWMLLDFEKMRPIRVDGVFKKDYIEREKKMIEEPFPRIVRSDQPIVLAREERVRLADIDVNRHVNNVRYIEWLIESVPVEIWQQKNIQELQVEYRKEAAYGDIIGIDTWAEPQIAGTVFSHCLTSGESNELMRARTVWV